MYSLRDCYYEDENYYVPCCEDYDNVGGKLVKTKVIKLVDKKQIYITDVPTEKIINKQKKKSTISDEEYVAKKKAERDGGNNSVASTSSDSIGTMSGDDLPF